MSASSTDAAMHQSPQNALLFSNSIHRKINRNFFRNDVALKSYKCDLFSADVDTAAKIYVSNTAIYIVHRPKRRKLITIPFAVVTDIAHCAETESVKIHVSSRTVYTLTNFQRPDPAIAFLVNFWKLICKEKMASKEFTSPGSLSIENSTPMQRCLRSSADTSLPRHLDPPTTVSLNNSASVSEPESISSRSPSITMYPSTTTTEPSYERRQIMAPNITNSCSSISPSEEESTVPVCIPANSPTTETTTQPVTDNFKVGNPECLTTQRSSVVPPPVGETHFPIPSHSVTQSNPPSTSHSSRNGALLVTDSTHVPKLTVHLTETSNWSVWPLSFLPYPFSPSPQRFTIVIAYAILAFLLFSTMHLYHRVTLFNPSVEPTLRIPPDRIPSAPSTSNEPLDHIYDLEYRLSQMVNLTSALAKSLAQMANQLHSLQKEMKSEAEPIEDTSAS